MADPARYDIDPLLVEGNAHPSVDKVTIKADLYIERSPSGKWVKWHDFIDYKAAQRRNKTEALVSRLGVENAEMRSRIKDLEAEVKRLQWAK